MEKIKENKKHPKKEKHNRYKMFLNPIRRTSMVNAVFGLLIKDDITPMIMGGARSGEDKIRIPMVGLESDDIQNIKKQLHAAINACCDSYKTHQCGFVSDGYK